MKKRLQLLHDVLVDTEENVSSKLLNNSKELLNLAVTYAGQVFQVHQQLNGMISSIEHDQFPENKQLDRLIVDLEDIEVPDRTEMLCKFRDQITESVYSLEESVGKCFQRMNEELRNIGDDCTKIVDDQLRNAVMDSLFKTRGVSALPSKELSLEFNPKVPLATKSHNFSEKVETCASASSIKSDRSCPKMPINIPSHATHGQLENKNNPIVSDDEIYPEDSVSNVNVPVVHKLRNLNEPKRVPISALGMCSNANSQRISVPRRTYSVRSEIVGVSCEWIENQFHPYKMWLRVNDEEYYRLHSEIASYNEREIVPREKIGRKLYCLAKYHNEWYRAYVTGVTENAAIVLFIDYGNVESVPFDEISYLPREFTKLPWQAFWTALCLVKPLKGHEHMNANFCSAWLEECRKLIRDLFNDVNNKVDCKIMEAPEKLPMLVNIRISKYSGNQKSIFLHKYLQDKSLVAAAENSEEQKYLLKGSVNALQSDNNGCKSDDDEYQNLSCEITSTTRPSEQSFLQIFNSISSQRPIELCPTISSIQNHVFITHVSPLGCNPIFIRLTSIQLPPQELLKKCIESKNVDVVAKHGGSVAYWSRTRNVYCRGEIVAITVNGERVNLLDVDTGIVDVGVHFPNEVGVLPKKLIAKHRCAFPISIDRGEHTVLRPDIDNFLKTNENRTFIMSIDLSKASKALDIDSIRQTKSPLPVSLVDSSGQSLGHLLFVNKDTIHVKVEDWKMNPPDADDEEDDDDLKIPDNPDEFLLGFQPKDDEMVCKFFKAGRRCPRGEYCEFKHVRLNEGETTTEKEIFGLVGLYELEAKSRIFVRLPCDWRECLIKKLMKNSQLVPLWLQMPFGDKDWNGKECDLIEIAYQSPITLVEEDYLDMEIKMTEFYTAKVANESHRRSLIPTPMMHGAVKVSSQLLGSDDFDDNSFAWVRGQVLQVMPDDYHAKCQLLDYGNEILANSDNIRPLDERFAEKLPSLSNMFYLGREMADKLSQIVFDGSECLVVDIIDFDNEGLTPIIEMFNLVKKNFDQVDAMPI